MNHDPFHSDQSLLWQGRIDVPRSEHNLRWHQVVVQASQEDIIKQTNPAIAFIGYACDEGVIRNSGRAGASLGPEAIRKSMSILPYFSGTTQIDLFDFGDVRCDDGNLGVAQLRLASAVGMALSHNLIPVVLGGGHDVAYGHYAGIKKVIGKNQVGIVNLDAHLDLRPDINGPNSGTPFFQIYKNDPGQFRYMAIGIQERANTMQLFNDAKRFGVSVLTANEIYHLSKGEIENRVQEFCSHLDYIQLTLDLDGFIESVAPGVSAPSPFGLAPSFGLWLIERIVALGKPISLDIAEMNPKYDIDGRTARLAAGLIFEFYKCLNKTLH